MKLQDMKMKALILQKEVMKRPARTLLIKDVEK